METELGEGAAGGRLDMLGCWWWAGVDQGRAPRGRTSSRTVGLCLGVAASANGSAARVEPPGLPAFSWQEEKMALRLAALRGRGGGAGWWRLRISGVRFFPCVLNGEGLRLQWSGPFTRLSCASRRRSPPGRSLLGEGSSLRASLSFARFFPCS